MGLYRSRKSLFYPDHFRLLANLSRLIELLHSLGGIVNQLWHINVRCTSGWLGGGSWYIGVDVETKSDHTVDSGGVRVGLVEVEARSEQGGLEQQQSQVPDGLVSLVLSDPSLEVDHDRVVGVDLENLLASHVLGHG